MTKKSSSLPIKFRLILGYLYFVIFASALVGALEFFGPSESVFAGIEHKPTGLDEFVWRSILGATSLATIVLAAWTTRLIHQRRFMAGIGFVLFNLVSYGLYTISPSAEGFPSIPAVIVSLAILALDVAITIYLLMSKEAKQVLNK